MEIKQRRQTEVALQKANNDKNKLFTIISHDLRGPFQVLLGNAELMLDQMEHLTPVDIQNMTSSIYKASQAAFNLLENLLTWSRLQQERIKYNPKPINLHELAENTVDLLKDMALSKQIRLTHTVEAGLFAHADHYMVDTVIRNLTSNALKFTSAGGQVTLSAHQNGVLAENGKSQWLEVKVSDTGIGISQKDIDKLFRIDVHHTTPGTAQEIGTGLGLILCQEMVKKNEGNIWVESEENKGTMVTFTVPAIECS